MTALKNHFLLREKAPECSGPQTSTPEVEQIRFSFRDAEGQALGTSWNRGAHRARLAECRAAERRPWSLSNLCGTRLSSVPGEQTRRYRSSNAGARYCD